MGGQGVRAKIGITLKFQSLVHCRLHRSTNLPTVEWLVGPSRGRWREGDRHLYQIETALKRGWKRRTFQRDGSIRPASRDAIADATETVALDCRPDSRFDLSRDRFQQKKIPMSGAGQPPDPRQVYRDYVADWDRYVAAAMNRALEYGKFSVEFGKLALQSGFILNGGALVSLAPLAQTVRDTGGLAAIDTCAPWFIFGLILIAAATGFAYYNHAVNKEATELQAIVHELELRASYGYSLASYDPKEKIEAKVKLRNKILTGTMIASIVLGIASYALFLGGALEVSSALGSVNAIHSTNPAHLTKEAPTKVAH